MRTLQSTDEKFWMRCDGLEKFVTNYRPNMKAQGISAGDGVSSGKFCRAMK
jgi:hypothetical protein